MSKKVRIDQLLVAQGLAPSRTRAQALVMAGVVLVNEQRVDKASECFDPQQVNLRLKGEDHPYVGRGGVKLAGALDHFKINPQEKVCLDVGASTGGFTDCLLQRGAKKIYTLDSGTNQLDYRLRQDPRVVTRENFNARHLKAEDLPEAVEIIVMDVSFISVTKIIPALIAACPAPWQGLFLIKPQFESEAKQIEKGGVVRDTAVHQEVLQKVTQFCERQNLEVLGKVPAVIQGEKGNQEYFIFLTMKD